MSVSPVRGSGVLIIRVMSYGCLFTATRSKMNRLFHPGWMVPGRNRRTFPAGKIVGG
jgi:hypothetical protein